MDLIRELVAQNYPGGAAAFEGMIQELRTAFPDIRYTVEDVLADRDRVAVHFRWTGTHRAPFRSFPASGKVIDNGGVAIYTLADGLIIGAVLETDRLGFLQQLGVVPSDASLRELASTRDHAIAVQRSPSGVYLIDTFTVPTSARPEFEAAMRRNREYIRSLDGFRGDAVFVRKQGDADFDIATIIAWDGPASIAHAKEQVTSFYREIGFDMPAAIARWGVTMQRVIRDAPAELQ